jgi:HSP20 family protein
MMNLVKWNPWREMNTMQNRLNHLFADAFFQPVRSDDDMSLGTWHPVVDMYDEEDRIVIKAELPGMEKKDIAVDVKDRVLTISGERKLDKEVEEENYYRRERTYGKFQRAFSLPADVDSDKIKADFKDGLLKIEVPKPEKQKPKQITVH